MTTQISPEEARWAAKQIARRRRRRGYAPQTARPSRSAIFASWVERYGPCSVPGCWARVLLPRTRRCAPATWDEAHAEAVK